MNSSTFASRFRVEKTDAARSRRAVAAVPVKTRRLNAGLSLLAMEPRMLFDGAGAATAVNHDPIAVADCRVLESDQQIVNGQALAGNAWGDAADFDADGDALQVNGIISGDWGGIPKGNVGAELDGVYGSIRMQADGSYHYVPYPDLNLAPGQSVTDVFTYTIGDGRGGETSSTLTLHITGAEPNHAPVGEIDYRIGLVGETTVGQAVLGNALGDHTDTDADGDALTVVGVSAGHLNAIVNGNVGQAVDGAYGRLTLQADGSYTYTARTDLDLAPGEHRMDVFTYTIADGHGGETSTWIKIHVEGPNHAPTARDDSRVLGYNEAVVNGQAVLGNAWGDAADTDPDGHVLRVTGVTAGNSEHVAESGVGQSIQGRFGVLTLNADGSYTYVPNRASSIAPGQSGQDVFSYLVGDGRGGCDVAQITLTVTRPADPAPPPPPVSEKPGPTKLIDPISIQRPTEMLEPAQVGKQTSLPPAAPFVAPIISRLSEIRPAANEPIRFEIPRDPFAPFSPERVLGDVQEMPAEPVAAVPAKTDVPVKDDCVDADKPVAKLKPKMVKPSAFAKPLTEAPKRFSEQIQAARKAFKAPAVVAPARVARDC